MTSLCAAVWAVAMILSHSVLWIPLLLIAAFFLMVFRINLYDRRIALQKEAWRRGQTPSAPYQYENLVILGSDD